MKYLDQEVIRLIINYLYKHLIIKEVFFQNKIILKIQQMVTYLVLVNTRQIYLVLIIKDQNLVDFNKEINLMIFLDLLPMIKVLSKTFILQ